MLHGAPFSISNGISLCGTFDLSKAQMQKATLLRHEAERPPFFRAFESNLQGIHRRLRNAVLKLVASAVTPPRYSLLTSLPVHR